MSDLNPFAVGDRIKLLRDVTCSTYIAYESNGYGQLTETGPPLSEGRRGTITKIIDKDEAFIDFDGSDTTDAWSEVWVLFAEIHKISILECLAEIADG